MAIPRSTASLLTLALPIWVSLAAISAQADPIARQKEIQITLFGQPCSLSGPMDEAGLRTVHGISPEQFPATPDPGQIPSLQEKLRKEPSAPPLLDHYREQLTQRLDAQADFTPALAAAKKSGTVEPLLLAARKDMTDSRFNAFRATLKKTAGTTLAAVWTSEQVELIYLAWNDSIIPHPEEEFHRAIRKLGLKYACSYEEESEGETD